MKDLSRTTIIRLIAAITVLTVVGSVIMVNIPWMGDVASKEKAEIVTLTNVMIILSMLVFAVVVVMMAYAIWKYRAKPGDESDGEPIHGNTRLEIIWTVIPTIIVLFGGVYSTIVLDNVEAKSDGPTMRVDVTAQQYAWKFDYVDEGITSNELHVPVGTQLDLKLNALDVLHSFWVPEWGIKRDLVPGADEPGGDMIDDTVSVTPDEEGTFSVVCTELCGWGHTTMRAAAVVESQESFDAWAGRQEELVEDTPSTGAPGPYDETAYDDEKKTE